MDRFISDLHLGHKIALNFDKRPFATLEEMEKAIVKNWNDVVEEADDVYILGDVGVGVKKVIPVLKQLKGKKHLIVGNWDANLLEDDDFKGLFIEIENYKEIEGPGGIGIVLSHYPIPCFKNQSYGWVMLHGHVHNSREDGYIRYVAEQSRAHGRECNIYNVSCMLKHMGYTPRTLEEIIRDYR